MNLNLDFKATYCRAKLKQHSKIIFWESSVCKCVGIYRQMSWQNNDVADNNNNNKNRIDREWNK